MSNETRLISAVHVLLFAGLNTVLPSSFGLMVSALFFCLGIAISALLSFGAK